MNKIIADIAQDLFALTRKAAMETDSYIELVFTSSSTPLRVWGMRDGYSAEKAYDLCVGFYNFDSEERITRKYECVRNYLQNLPKKQAPDREREEK